MGNSDSFTSAMVARGTNEVVNFKGGYFSFAFGNEIALALKDIDDYFILNCDKKLFNEVKKKVKSGATKAELKRFWIKKSKEYEISSWSADFDELKRKQNDRNNISGR